MTTTSLRAAAGTWAAGAARRRSAGALAAAVGGVALADRALPALRWPLWADEVASARILLEPSLGAAIQRVRQTESTPPGWYVLAWLAHRAGQHLAAPLHLGGLAGIDALRVISVLAGAATCALTVVYARRLVPLWAAAIAGLVLALAGMQISLGTELRAYALYTLLSLLFAMALAAAAEWPRPRALAALAATVAAGAYVHYFFLLVVAAGLAWLLLDRHPWRTRALAGLAVALALLLFLPWLPGWQHQIEHSRHGWIPSFRASEAWRLYGTLLLGRLRGAGAASLAVLALVLAGCAVLARTRRGRLCLAMAVAPVVAASAFGAAGQRVFDTRNLIAVAPFAAVAVAAALSALPRRWPRVLLAAVVAAGVVLAFAGALEHGRRPWNAIAAEAVRMGWTQREPILVFSRGADTVAPLGWYLPGHPELHWSRQGPGACASLLALVDSARGRAWLRAHRGDLAAEHSFARPPSDGGDPGAPLLLVRARWSGDLLAGLPGAGAAIMRGRLKSLPCASR